MSTKTKQTNLDDLAALDRLNAVIAEIQYADGACDSLCMRTLANAAHERGRDGVDSAALDKMVIRAMRRRAP